MFQYYRSFYGYVIGLQIRKQIGKKYIYQVRNGIQIRKKYAVPTNPRTYLQQLNRWKISQAVLSWQMLPESEKQSYRNGEPYRPTMSGYNYYISEYVKTEV